MRAGAATEHARGSVDAAVPAVDAATVLRVLERVVDPEIPAVSVVDLGLIGSVSVEPGGGPIRVELLPTFVGCHALGVMRADVEMALAAFDRPVHVRVSFETPWTSDRITPAGRDALRRSGFAPPVADGTPTPCPYCGSERTVMDGLFGPTQCRSLFYCRTCRQPFEAFKSV